MTNGNKIGKKRSIGVISKELDLPTHVIRFWETQFPQIKPTIGKGQRRYYYDEDFEMLKSIKRYLHEEGYTIRGLKSLLEENRGLLLKEMKESSSKKVLMNNIKEKIDSTKSSVDEFKSLIEEI